MMNLEKCLETFKASTPFYRKKLRGIKSFDHIPLTTKNELIESQRKFPPYGNFTDFTKNIFQVYRTSGTANTPLMLSFTKSDVEMITRIGAQCFQHAGMGDIGNKEIIINCLNLSLWAGGFFDAQAMMKTGIQVINFGTGNTSELIRLILLYNKKYKVSLHCTPSYLPVIEKKLRNEFKLDLSSLKIFTLYLGAEGGIENNEFRNDIQTRWRCRAFNANYGISELCSVMASAAEDNVLKYSDLFLQKYFVELLSENEEISPVSDGKPGDVGDIVVTSLFKKSQPLLRYHTHERIRILQRSGKNIFFEVLGRSDSMIVYKGINIFPEQFREVLNLFPELTGIYKLKIHKEASLITKIFLICEANKRMGKDDFQLEQKLLYAIKSKFSVSPEIIIVGSILREGNKVKIVEYC
jgi:phenylacetate-CoA ligase